MSYDIGAIRQALAANLSTLNDVNSSAYLQSTITPPTAQVMPAAHSFHSAMGEGVGEVHFTVQLFVSANLTESAQVNLDALMGNGADGVKYALESDNTLGGIVSDVTVTEVSEPKIYTGDGRPALLGCEFSVRVLV
jgi:hypothetical protein